jgi:hypothetical protein
MPRRIESDLEIECCPRQLENHGKVSLDIKILEVEVLRSVLYRLHSDFLGGAFDFR